ncbi:hypothetical protein CAEBREN_08214 [Caenorhabditis brenneri]|uniref:Uncharacterized protein n=1 Tax=Caenorhabditis brenneri TaxID=135651 RepID=G0MXA5_CAEBE|nr:hypothetical protein CAEBREN_08214 [Caenorhabditis brenneri]
MDRIHSHPEKDGFRPLLSEDIGDRRKNQVNEEYISCAGKNSFYQNLEMLEVVRKQTTDLFEFSKEQAERINDLRNKKIADVNQEVDFFVSTVVVDCQTLYKNIRVVVLQQHILDGDNQKLKAQILLMNSALLSEFHHLTETTYENAESLTFLLHNALISDAAVNQITMKSVESELSRLLLEAWESIAVLRHRSGFEAKMFTDQVHAKTINSDDSPKD